jgi:hypothetical protein
MNERGCKTFLVVAARLRRRPRGTQGPNVLELEHAGRNSPAGPSPQVAVTRREELPDRLMDAGDAPDSHSLQDGAERLAHLRGSLGQSTLDGSE